MVVEGPRQLFTTQGTTHLSWERVETVTLANNRSQGIHSTCGTSLLMSAEIIDGKKIAAQVEAEVRDALGKLRFKPGLAAVRVGNDPASEVYVRNKARKAKELGLAGGELVFDGSMHENDLLAEVDRLNNDNNIDGILVQLPLPKQIDPKKVIDAINPAKDVDGFHPINVGLLHMGRPALVPCTPAGVMRLIAATGIDIAGKRAVVIGRSDIVGKPVAALLLRENATVTICHSRTRDLPDVVREADIVVAAIGKPRFVTAEMVKRGAVVIDVGINRVDGKLVGDVDFERVRDVASWITPVPGGVGPMTIAMLMKNTVTAAQKRPG